MGISIVGLSITIETIFDYQRVFDGNIIGHTLWQTNIAIENGHL